MEGMNLKGLNIAIMGGINPCREIIELLLSDGLKELNCTILAVADTFTGVEGIKYAKEQRLLTLNNYDDILKLENLDLIFKLARNKTVAGKIKKAGLLKPKLLNLDHSRAMALISHLKIEQEKLNIRKKIKDGGIDQADLETIINQFSDRITDIAEERIRYFQDETQSRITMEKELNQIIHGSMIPTFIINKEHIISHWNRACEELTGYKSYELVGTDRQWSPFRSSQRPTMADVIVGGMNEDEVRKYYGDNWKKSTIIKEAYEAEEFFPHLGANGKWIFFMAAPIKSEDGTIIGAIETLSDNTQARKAQEELRIRDEKLAQLYNQYRILFNNNPNPIFIVDNSTLEILDVNNSVEYDYGYSKEQLLGKPFFEVINGMSINHSYTPEMISLFKEKSKPDQRSSNMPWEELTLRTQTGEHIPVRYSTSFLNKKEELMGCAFFFHDLTQIKQLEKELVQSERLAAIGQTISGLSHCIKNILLGLKGGSYVVDIGLKNDNIDKLKDGWQTIKNNIARTSDLVQDMLTVSKERKPEYQNCYPNEIVEDVVRLVDDYAKKQNIEIIQQLDPRIGEVVMAPQTIHRSLLNLISNSIDACMDVAVCNKILEIHLETLFLENNLLGIIVRDNGAGMSKEDKNSLFNPFFSTKGNKGTGLGLLVTGKLIEEHHGTINVLSTLGKGSQFTIKLPYDPVKQSMDI